jgi:hypothetical protein
MAMGKATAGKAVAKKTGETVANVAAKQTQVRGLEKIARQMSVKQGISVEQARAILAKGARNASPSAVARNPNLLKVRR